MNSWTWIFNKKYLTKPLGLLTEDHASGIQKIRRVRRRSSSNRNQWPRSLSWKYDYWYESLQRRLLRCGFQKTISDLRSSKLRQECSWKLTYVLWLNIRLIRKHILSAGCSSTIELIRSGPLSQIWLDSSRARSPAWNRNGWLAAFVEIATPSTIGLQTYTANQIETSGIRRTERIRTQTVNLLCSAEPRRTNIRKRQQWLSYLTLRLVHPLCLLVIICVNYPTTTRELTLYSESLKWFETWDQNGKMHLVPRAPRSRAGRAPNFVKFDEIATLSINFHGISQRSESEFWILKKRKIPHHRSGRRKSQMTCESDRARPLENCYSW